MRPNGRVTRAFVLEAMGVVAMTVYLHTTPLGVFQAHFVRSMALGLLIMIYCRWSSHLFREAMHTNGPG